MGCCGVEDLGIEIKYTTMPSSARLQPEDVLQKRLSFMPLAPHPHSVCSQRGQSQISVQCGFSKELALDPKLDV